MPTIVDQTAEFMASFAEYDAALKRYFLGPPLIPAQESYPPAQTFNPTYELSYWAWGLKTVQRWRERRNVHGLPDGIALLSTCRLCPCAMVCTSAQSRNRTCGTTIARIIRRSLRHSVCCPKTW